MDSNLLQVTGNPVEFSDAKLMFSEVMRDVTRDGVDELLAFLERTDFYTAPSSTKFHNAFKHGLLYHSLNVYHVLVDLVKRYASGEYSDETVAIVGLLHDLCKVNFYKLEPRNRKIDGEWRSVLEYVVDDKLPLGHGEKSVIMIQRFFELNGFEALAINWHMGSFDARASNYVGTSQLAQALGSCKLVTLLHTADLIASNVYEVVGPENK